MKYRAFISYRHLEPDSTAAVTMHRMLEKYTVPARLRKGGERHLGRIFRDEDELPLTPSLSDSIQSALEESEYLIVICTPQFRESLWCMKEVETFIRLRGRDHVLAVLVTGKPEESFPPQLLADEKGNPCEPLAANVSSDDPAVIRRRLRQEHLRLAAAMIGCDYDDLVRRARRRHTRLAVSAVLVVLATAVAFISVLLVKNTQVSRALRQAQRNESEAVSFIAADLLSKGDRQAAVEKTVAALPGSEDPDRPYVAACEEVLADALYVYGDSRLFLQRALVDTFSEIKSVAVARDGSAAFAGYLEGTVKAISPDGEILWTTIIPGWEKSYEMKVQALADNGLLISSTSGVCFLDPETGTILRQENAYLLAAEDRYVLMRKYENYEYICCLTDQVGNDIRHFKVGMEQDYTLAHWGLTREGKIAFLAEKSEDDAVFLVIPEENGGTDQMIPLDLTSDFEHSYSLCMTNELALVYSQTLDWYALFMEEEDSTITEVTAYRLADGQKLWRWEANYFSTGMSVIDDTENNRVILWCSFSSRAAVLNDEDGQLLSEISLSGDVKALVPYTSSAGFYCLRAFLADGTVVNIDPDTGFSMAFGGAASGITLADANSLYGKISAAGTASDAPQNLVLISRAENPGEHILLEDINTTAVAVSADGRILTAKNKEDKDETELRWFDPADSDNCVSYTVPVSFPHRLIGITEGNLAVFGSRETDSSEINYVSLDDGETVTESGVLGKRICSVPAKEVWSACFDYHMTEAEIRRNGEAAGTVSLPEGSIEGTETIGAGWIAVAASDGDGICRLYVCDLDSGAWMSPAENRPWDNPLLACGIEQKQVAAVDSDGIFILDESLRMVRNYSLPADRSSVTGITFSLDDKLICLTLSGSRACFIRLSDGASSGIVSVDDSDVLPWVERTASGDYTVSFTKYTIYQGLVLSGNDLKVKARVSGLLGILPGTDTMLHSGDMQYNTRLILSRVYSLEELLEISKTGLR